MKKLLALLLVLALVLSMAACGKKEEASQAPEDGNNTLAVESTPVEEAVPDPWTHEFSQYGNAKIQIVGSEFLKNDYDEDILRIYYEYTNTSTGDDARGHYPSTCLNFISVTQDGNECLGYGFTPWDEAYIPEDGNANMYVQPGRTMRNTVCFRCDPNGGPVKLSCYVMVGSWVYEEDKIEPFEFEVDPANLMGAPAPFALPPIPDPTYTSGMSASGTYGYFEHEISINGVELTKDYDGVDVLRVKLTVTNNDQEAWSPAMICDLELYQDGIGLPYPTTWDLEEPTAEDEAYEEDLEPGETVDCNALYYLRNQNPVEAVIESPDADARLGARFDVKALFEAASAEDKAAADAAAAAAAAASAADKAIMAEMVGVWDRTNSWPDHITFNADLTGIHDMTGDLFPFTYLVTDGIVTLTYDDGEVVPYKVEVSGNDMLLADADWGDESTWIRAGAEEPEEAEPKETEAPTEAAEPTLKELVIGTWQDQETEYKETFTFKKDGTGVYGFEDGGHWEYTFTYEWYDGDYLEFTYDDDGSVGGFTVRIEDDVMYVSNMAVVDMPLVRK